jgi:hypothetical protein
MMNANNTIFENEIDGQIDFLKTYLPSVNPNCNLDDIPNCIADNTINGNFIMLKLEIPDLANVLVQAIKALSAMRIKGKSIPANIMLVALNEKKAYLYHSFSFLAQIERVYGSGSNISKRAVKDKKPVAMFYYIIEEQAQQMVEALKTCKYTKIHLDENCIVGWATRYYRENKKARKADFIGDNSSNVKITGEIRKPTHFKDYIYAYKDESNERFRYLMDMLNDFLDKKDLGAFYTNRLYADKSLDLVRQAIKRVPEGNDYVIIDRCAGTGNLELGMTDEELSHVIVSTLEYYEYKVLLETIGDKVRDIVPPTESKDTFNYGMVKGADALSEEFIKSDMIMKYVNDPKCTIILFENPPYSDATSIEHQKLAQGKMSSNKWKTSYAVAEMKKDLKAKGIKGTATNDLGNVFIWSAFKYYLRQPTDSYIVYSPAKYWKAQHLISKKLLGGYAFNRRHFHTNIAATILVALWSNEDDNTTESFSLHAYDIDTAENKLVGCGKVTFSRIHEMYSQRYFDKRIMLGDTPDGILCDKSGYEISKDRSSIRIRPTFNEDIIGYMAVYSSGFDNPDNMSSLLIAGRYDGNGFFLRQDNYMEKLPMFAASRYITYNRQWTERGRVMKSADGAYTFIKDSKKAFMTAFLRKCLLFTIFEPQNHIISQHGSDGRYYRNQLCLDTTNGATLASLEIGKMKTTAEERELIALWEKILEEAKLTKEYDKGLTYGLYQIRKELNLTYKDAEGKTQYTYPQLNDDIKLMAEKVKDYYNANIVPTLFKYEFLK